MSAALFLPTDHPELREVLRAQLRIERLRAARELLQYILAFDGLVVWLDVIFPRLIKSPLGLFATIMWPALFVLFAALWILERRTVTRLAHLMTTGIPPAE